MVAPRWVEPHDDRDVVFSSAWRAKCKAFEAEQKPLVPVLHTRSLAAILKFMSACRSSIEKIRAELAWVTETPDPNKCG
jgi:hypothetical protein